MDPTPIRCCKWNPSKFPSLTIQEMVDFLVKCGADITIVDKTGRTAQEIAEYLGHDIVIKNVRSNFDDKEFKLFTNNPFDFFMSSKLSCDEKKNRFNYFKMKFNDYIMKGEKNDILDELLMINMKKSKNVDSKNSKNDKSIMRKNFKRTFHLKLADAKKKLILSKEVKKHINNKLFEKEEEFPNISDEEQLYNLVYDQMFTDWCENKSQFMDEIDKLVIGDVDYHEVFHEISDFFDIMDDYFSGKVPNPLETLQTEIKELKKQLAEKDEFIEHLKVHGDNVSTVRHDGFLIEEL